MMKDIEDRRKFDWKTYQILIKEKPLNFIRRLLSSTRSQVKEEVRKMVKGMKKEERLDDFDGSFDREYNQAIEDLLNKITPTPSVEIEK